LTVGINIPPPRFLESLAGGVAVKLVHGYGYFEVVRFHTSLHTDHQATLTGQVDFLSRQSGPDPTQARFINRYKLFPEVAGRGVGFDVGSWGRVNDYLMLGLSATDIGKVKWRKNIVIKQADTTLVVDDPLNEQQRSSIERALRGTTQDGSPFTTQLPTAVRLGAAVEIHHLPQMKGMPGEMLIELNYNQFLEETPFSTTIPRVSIGIEYKPIEWIPIRSGMSFGGTDHLNLALGVGLHFSMFEFELASENVTWLLAPRSFSRGSLAVGARFKL
jgi:hypothetical protein